MLATCSWFHRSRAGLWLYWPLCYAQSITKPLSYLPRLYLGYTVALHRYHWFSIWCKFLLLGYKRGKTGLPLLTFAVWVFFRPGCWLYHLMGSILWNPIPPVHSLCCWRAPRRAIHDQLSATCGKNLSKLFGFVYLCLGRVCLGFAASTIVRNGLFWPFETLSLDLLGL